VCACVRARARVCVCVCACACACACACEILLYTKMYVGSLKINSIFHTYGTWSK